MDGARPSFFLSCRKKILLDQADEVADEHRFLGAFGIGGAAAAGKGHTRNRQIVKIAAAFNELRTGDQLNAQSLHGE